jgi:hypothetical protein
LSIARTKLVIAGFAAKPETLTEIGSAQAAIVNVCSTVGTLEPKLHIKAPSGH